MKVLLILVFLFPFSVSACSENNFVENTLVLKDVIPKLGNFEYQYEGSTVLTGIVKPENVLANMIYLNYVPEHGEPGVFILSFDIGDEKFYLYHFNFGGELPLKPIEGKWTSCNEILFKDSSNGKFYSLLEFDKENKVTVASYESGNSSPFLSYNFY